MNFTTKAHLECYEKLHFVLYQIASLNGGEFIDEFFKKALEFLGIKHYKICQWILKKKPKLRLGGEIVKN